MDLSDNNHVSSTINFNEPVYENEEPEEPKHGKNYLIFFPPFNPVFNTFFFMKKKKIAFKQQTNELLLQTKN